MMGGSMTNYDDMTALPSRSYHFERQDNGDLVGEVKSGDRVQRFHLTRDGEGNLVGEIEEVDPVDAAPTAGPERVTPEPNRMFAGIFGSIKDL